MNPALVFVLLVVAMAIVVTWWLMRALKRDRLRDAPDTRSTNVEALRIERAELERDRKLGLMSDAAFDEAMRELEVRVLRENDLDRATPHVAATKRSLWATASFATLLPIAAMGMYFLIGAPHAVIPEVVRPPQAQQESQMEELFRVAEERLNAEPNDAKGRYLLARARASVGQFNEAMKDYEKLVALTPNDADAWADYADAAAGAVEGKMAGKPLELVNKALAIDPKQPKALLLRGTHEMQINDLNAAEKSFTMAKSVSDPQTGFARIADNALKDIAVRRGGAGSSTDAKTNAQNSPALLSLNITLSIDAKKAATAKDAVVFAIIRAADAASGPPMAVKKLSPSALDKPIEIGANDSMIGGAGLAPGSEVSLEVRLSVSGQPRAQVGDYASERVKIKLPSDGKALSQTVLIGKKIDS
ncbi:MAG: c-type cytochrome biogenesis protein CcmI [Casimicrobium sp.]